MTCVAPLQRNLDMHSCCMKNMLPVHMPHVCPVQRLGRPLETQASPHLQDGLHVAPEVPIHAPHLWAFAGTAVSLSTLSLAFWTCPQAHLCRPTADVTYTECNFVNCMLSLWAAQWWWTWHVRVGAVFLKLQCMQWWMFIVTVGSFLLAYGNRGGCATILVVFACFELVLL